MDLLRSFFRLGILFLSRNLIIYSYSRRIYFIMNKKYVVFGLAAALAIIGVVYFGTGANQQASVAALGTIATPIGPITTNPNDPGWTKLCKDRKPHLQVLSPNGGETYQAGQQITVKWRSCNVPSMHNLIIETFNFFSNSSNVKFAFTRYSLTPKSKHFLMSASSPRFENTITLIFLSLHFLGFFARISNPDSFGNINPKSSRSGGVARAFSTPSSPVAAISIAKPSACNFVTANDRKKSSSSTINIRYAI
jgi:hypothetical protein